MAEQPYSSPEPLEMITAIVHRGKAQKIAHAAIEAGAHAVTIHFARGKIKKTATIQLTVPHSKPRNSWF